MKFNNVLESIGNTPHIRLSKLFPGHDVWLKDERRNPGFSIKDRIAIAMIESAEKAGKLKSGGIIIEPTSGNTGIGLAMAGAFRGYRVILVMPETMSVERRKMLKAFGAEIILTPGEEGMKGAIRKASELAQSAEGSWMPMQFDNPANPEIHSLTTAREIIADFPGGLDYLVAGIGTGGHITGVGRILRQEFSGIKVVAVEPFDSPVLSGGKPGPHRIQGIGAGFVPGNYDGTIPDRIIQVKNEDAFAMTRRIAAEEGIITGISSGASLWAVQRIVEESSESLRILTFAYDSGERYLSIPGLWE